jgi:hypothetical protein
MPFHDLADSAWVKVQVPLYFQSSWAANGFQLRKNEVSTPFLKANYVAEEQEIAILSRA